MEYPVQIHKKTQSLIDKERIEALNYIKYNIKNFNNIKKIWEDLHRLTKDNNNYVRKSAADVLGSAFAYMPDRDKAWEDLIRLTHDEEAIIALCAAGALGSAFAYMPDRDKAWEDLIRLTHYKHDIIAFYAAYALSSTFAHMPDRDKAWEDLHRLTQDNNDFVRWGAACALGSALGLVPDNDKVWEDLHRLTQDKKDNVRMEAAYALGSAFALVLDKSKAWEDLIRLTQDEKGNVRLGAFYSLGKACIFKATQVNSEVDIRCDLENAIGYFEKSSSITSYNPASFCLPFYRSFYALTFKNETEAKVEVNKYLTEAKNAIGESKNKELLFTAMENLSLALEEAHNLKDKDINHITHNLNVYRIYCENAADLLNESEKENPLASKLVRKGLPIINIKIKNSIIEIQKKASIACKESKGTDTEKIACDVNQEVQQWKIGSQEYLEMQIVNLVDKIKFYIAKTQENSSIIHNIDSILHEPDIVKQYAIINILISQIVDIQVSRKTDSMLMEIRGLRYDVDKLVASIDTLQDPEQYLTTIQNNLEEIKSYMPELESKIDEVLYELYSPLSTTQKLKVAIPIIPTIVSYEIETDVPRLVADKIFELKKLIRPTKK